MFKKILTASVLCTIVSFAPACAEISQQDMMAAQGYYERADKLSKSNQYSSALEELKKGLRLNPYDNNIRIGLINNHLLRATYYNNNSKEYIKAMNDLRAALFYLKYFGKKFTDENAAKAVTDNEYNLKVLYEKTQIATHLKNRYQIAKNLKASGDFAASAYEFIQASADETIQEDCFIQVGDLMTVLGNHLQSADYYRKALTIDETNGDSHLKLAKAYDAMGESKLADAEYNYTLRQANNNRALMLELESIWVKKIGTNPNDAEAHTNLGAVYQYLGDYPKALQEYSRAKVLNPKNQTTRFNIGTLYQSQQEYSLAINAYDEVLQLNPQDKMAREYKAQCLMELKEFENAADEYKKLSTLDPNNSTYKNLMYEAMRQVAPQEEVIETLAEQTEQNPQDATTTYNYAYELHKANKLDDAITNYTNAIKIDSKNPDSYINLAQAYKQKNDYVNAEKVITQGLNILPNNEQIKTFSKELKEELTSIRYATGGNMFNEGKYKEAIDTYLLIEPKDADTYLNLASCYQALEDNANAIKYFKLALSKSPNNADITFYLAQAYVNAEDWTNAKATLVKSSMLKPNEPKVKELLAYVIDQQDQILLERALDLYNQNNYTNALAILNNVLTQNKSNAFAYYYKGLIYDAQKQYAAAAAEYQKSIALSEAIPEAHYSLALDYDYLNKYKEALAQYKQYLGKATQPNEYTDYAQKRIQDLSSYAN